jgi:hypothetical protein
METTISQPAGPFHISLAMETDLTEPAKKVKLHHGVQDFHAILILETLTSCLIIDEESKKLKTRVLCNNAQHTTHDTNTNKNMDTSWPRSNQTFEMYV